MNEIQEILNQKADQQKSNENFVFLHYYGDQVRRLYFLAAAVMLIGLPFVGQSVAIPIFISVISILVLDFLAGLTNPKQLWVHWANTLVSAAALIIFETAAIGSLASYKSFIFIINQFLAVLFLVAVYYNTKTLRAMLLK